MLWAQGALAQAFVEVPAPFPALSYSAIAWGDYDNDGHWDCIITGIRMTIRSVGG